MKPQPGFCTCVDGDCVQFLHIQKEDGAHEVWRVRPIFQEAEDYDIKIRAGETFRPLHSTTYRQ